MYKTPRELAQAYWKAECAHDIPAVLSCFNEDAIFCPPGKVLKGHPEIRTFYDAAFRRFAGLEVTIVHEISDANQGCMEWQAVLIDAQGQRFPLNGANVLTMKNGKYATLHSYFDPTLLMR